MGVYGLFNDISEIVANQMLHQPVTCSFSNQNHPRCWVTQQPQVAVTSPEPRNAHNQYIFQMSITKGHLPKDRSYLLWAAETGTYDPAESFGKFQTHPESLWCVGASSSVSADQLSSETPSLGEMTSKGIWMGPPWAALKWVRITHISCLPQTQTWKLKAEIFVKMHRGWDKRQEATIR